MNFEDFVKKHGTSSTFRKGQHIFRQGDKNDCLYYVSTGLLKAYYVSHQGKENIKSFIKKNNVIGSLSAAHKGQACTFNLIALEDVVLFRFKFEQLFTAAHQSHEVAKQLIDTLLSLSMKKEQREYEFLMLSAEQRYMSFVKQEPELAQQLTQNDVARYLGITPVALSRIKKRCSLAPF